MPEKHEFGSTGWINTACRFVLERAAAAPHTLEGVEYTSCEVFTNVPDHLAIDESKQRAWHMRFSGGTVECAEGEPDAADRKVIGDYQALLPLVRLTIAGPEGIGQEGVQQILTDLMQSGKLKIESSGKERPSILEGLHDQMVTVTI